MTEEWVSELRKQINGKYRRWRIEKLKQNEQKLRDLLGDIKQSYIRVIRIPDEEERKYLKK